MDRITVNGAVFEYVLRDYYEFFGPLNGEYLERDYEKLIFDLLSLAGIPKEKCSVRWKGSFDRDEKENVTVSYGNLASRFELNFQGETVDIDNLLKGLNKLVKLRNPREKRKLDSMQMYDDQSGCVWFATGKQLRQLCPALHASWDCPEDHLCKVTARDVKKRLGAEGLKQLIIRNVKREEERLNNIVWEVLPAKRDKND